MAPHRRSREPAATVPRPAGPAAVSTHRKTVSQNLCVAIMAVLPSAMLATIAKNNTLAVYVESQTATQPHAGQTYVAISAASARDPPLTFNISQAAVPLDNVPWLVTVPSQSSGP